MPTRAQLKRQAEEAEAAAAAASSSAAPSSAPPAAAEEGVPTTTGKKGRPTSGKSKKQKEAEEKQKAEEAAAAEEKRKADEVAANVVASTPVPSAAAAANAEPPPSPAVPAAAAPVTEEDVVEIVFEKLRPAVAPTTTDDRIREVLRETIPPYVGQERDPAAVLAAVLAQEGAYADTLENIAQDAYAQLVPPGTPPPASPLVAPAGSAAAAAAANAGAPPTPGSVGVAPLRAPSAASGEGGFAPTPTSAAPASQASSMSASALSLSSASSMGSVSEETTGFRARRLRELTTASDQATVAKDLAAVGEKPVDFAALAAADAVNPIYLFEYLEYAKSDQVRAMAMCVLYSINVGGARYDQMRILALGTRPDEPPSLLTDLLRMATQFVMETYPIQSPTGPLLNPTILIQYARNQSPEGAAAKAELAATLKELKKTFVPAPANVQGQATGLVLKGGGDPIANWDAVAYKDGDVAGEVACRYTTFQPLGTKTVRGDDIVRVAAHNPATKTWGESPTIVLVSVSGILGKQHTLVIPPGQDAYRWTLPRIALVGNETEGLAPVQPTLPGSTLDLFNRPRGGRRKTYRKKARKGKTAKRRR